MELSTNSETYFVAEGSIVRRIWGCADTVLVIFAGAAAEFALNKAVDWLYFTGKIPNDPIGRLFSTVTYAHRIIFSGEEEASNAIQSINRIHSNVEQARGSKIPDWAYRDVLYMLIDYSIRSFELLDRKLTECEKEELFDVFLRMGKNMALEGLPDTFSEWQISRDEHLRNNLAAGNYTRDLFLRYRVHLGPIRYRLMVQVQSLILPLHPLGLLNFSRPLAIRIPLRLYRRCRRAAFSNHALSLLLPKKYKTAIASLNRS